MDDLLTFHVAVEFTTFCARVATKTARTVTSPPHRIMARFELDESVGAKASPGG